MLPAMADHSDTLITATDERWIYHQLGAHAAEGSLPTLDDCPSPGTYGYLVYLIEDAAAKRAFYKEFAKKHMAVTKAEQERRERMARGKEHDLEALERIRLAAQQAKA